MTLNKPFIWKKHAQNSGVVAISIASGAVFSFLTLWLLARYYTPEEYGAFSVAWAAAQIVVPLATFGIPQFLIQRFKREGKYALRWTLPAEKSLLLLGGLAVSGYAAWILLSDISLLARLLGLLLLPWIVATIPVTVVFARYQIEHRLLMQAGWPLLQIAPRLLVVIACVFLFSLPIWSVAIGFLAVMLPLAWRGIKDIRGMGWEAFGQGLPDVSSAKVSKLHAGVAGTIRSAWPFGAVDLLDKLDLRLVVLLAALLINENMAGQFSIAVSIVLLIYLFPSAVMQRYFLPHLHDWSARSPRTLLRFTLTTTALLALLSILAVPVVWWLVEPTILWLYGKEYEQSITIFRAMILAIPVWLISSTIIRTFLSLKKIRQLAVIQLFGLASMLISAMVLHPQFGMTGIAWALVIGRATLLVLCVLFAGGNFRSEGTGGL